MQDLVLLRLFPLGSLPRTSAYKILKASYGWSHDS